MESIYIQYVRRNLNGILVINKEKVNFLNEQHPMQKQATTASCQNEATRSFIKRKHASTSMTTSYKESNSKYGKISSCQLDSPQFLLLKVISIANNNPHFFFLN